MSTPLTLRQSQFPLMSEACQALAAAQPAFRSLVASLMDKSEAYWRNGEARCQEIRHLCGDDPIRFQQAVGAWIDFAIEYQRRQLTFQRTGTYAAVDFSELERDLYSDSEAMKQSYLMALLFSFIFSPNYAEILAFFQAEFLPRISGATAVCDVGCGHGVYLTEMLKTAPAARGLGLDISPGSLETAESLLRLHRIPQERWALRLGNVMATLPADTASQDALCCFEVIEHIADPRHALGELHRVLRPGGAICLSTAVRMESVDHLYLFKHPDEVRSMLTECGFVIEQDRGIPLTTEDVSDPAVLARLIDDPKVALGYVMVGHRP